MFWFIKGQKKVLENLSVSFFAPYLIENKDLQEPESDLGGNTLILSRWYFSETIFFNP